MKKIIWVYADESFMLGHLMKGGRLVASVTWGDGRIEEFMAPIMFYMVQDRLSRDAGATVQYFETEMEWAERIASLDAPMDAVSAFICEIEDLPHDRNTTTLRSAWRWRGGECVVDIPEAKVARKRAARSMAIRRMSRSFSDAERRTVEADLSSDEADVDALTTADELETFRPRKGSS